ncbi:aldo/keto reductase [Pseudodesulfovibrio pelocollis]|uniref:aldo/keto reductase n=1 Tax=Pseudodesulfovibrio pelocollis TaxID=3051432 RepID=UPI00255ADFAD|nr:aldo/keto reductase [Pseudodesulfovibrio sp. SB368]
MADARLILGTAQLGMRYGVANDGGQPDHAAAMDIVRTAWEGGVREFDTASSYGESEAVLGRILHDLGIADRALVNSKPDAHWDGTDMGALDRDLDTSLSRLGVDRLHTLILHRESLLGAWPRMAPGLARLVDSGRVQRIGVSVYTPGAARDALLLDGLDVVQIPSNLLDRRFEIAGIRELADEQGKHLQIRSIYLQGLIFMTPQTLPADMDFAQSVVRDVQALSSRMGLAPLEAALGYVRKAWPDSTVLFGAEKAAQVHDNLKAWRRDVPDMLIDEARKVFADLPEKILNPSLWGR